MHDSSHHRHEADHSRFPESHRPYWKRAHHDWRFWAALVLMLAAMIIFVMSDNFAWLPRVQPPQPPSGAVGKWQVSADLHNQEKHDQ